MPSLFPQQSEMLRYELEGEPCDSIIIQVAFYHLWKAAGINKNNWCNDDCWWKKSCTTRDEMYKIQ